MLQCCTVLYSISANAEWAELNTALVKKRISDIEVTDDRWS
jgi:hypothetical protein